MCGYIGWRGGINDERIAGAARATGVVAGGPGGEAGGIAADGQRHQTGRYDPSLELAFKIAQVFGQSIEEIFRLGNGSGAPARPVTEI